MRLRFKATHVVLAMLCIMYFITYVDRVNIGTAASEIQKELSLSNTQLGLVFSAFAYPYLLFQVIGGWVGDRFGPRQTLVWSACCGAWSGRYISATSRRIILPSPTPNWRRCRRARAICGLRYPGKRCCGGCGRLHSLIFAMAGACGCTSIGCRCFSRTTTVSISRIRRCLPPAFSLPASSATAWEESCPIASSKRPVMFALRD